MLIKLCFANEEWVAYMPNMPNMPFGHVRHVTPCHPEGKAWGCLWHGKYSKASITKLTVRFVSHSFTCCYICHTCPYLFFT